jgi:hypothetical protein
VSDAKKEDVPALWAVIDLLLHPLHDCARNELKGLIAERDEARAEVECLRTTSLEYEDMRAQLTATRQLLDEARDCAATSAATRDEEAVLRSRAERERDEARAALAKTEGIWLERLREMTVCANCKPCDHHRWWASAVLGHFDKARKEKP